MTDSETKELKVLKDENADLKGSLRYAKQAYVALLFIAVVFAGLAVFFMIMGFVVMGSPRGAGYPASMSSLTSGERYVVEATICEKEKPCLALIRTESGPIKFIESPDALEVGGTYLCYTNTTGSGKQQRTHYHLLKVEK